MTHPTESTCWSLKSALSRLHDAPVLACGPVLPAVDIEEALECGAAPRYHDLEQLTGHFGRAFAVGRPAEFEQGLHDAAAITLLVRDRALEHTAFALAAQAYMLRCDSADEQRLSLAIGYAYFPARRQWEAHAWCFYDAPGGVQVVELTPDPVQRPGAYFGFTLIADHTQDDFGSPFVDHHTDPHLWANLVAAQSGLQGH